MRPIDIVFPERAARRQQGLCSTCDNTILVGDFRDELSRMEFGISGMCQECQDNVFQRVLRLGGNPFEEPVETAVEFLEVAEMIGLSQDFQSRGLIQTE